MLLKYNVYFNFYHLVPPSSGLGSGCLIEKTLQLDMDILLVRNPPASAQDSR